MNHLHLLTNRILMFFLILSAVISAISCEKGSDRDQMSITVLTSVYGPNDHGYSEKINDAILAWKADYPEIDMEIVTPKDYGDAQNIYFNWLAESPREGQSLFIFETSEYVETAKSDILSLNTNQKILLMEVVDMDFPKGVYSFAINRTAPSYLAGCMAKDHEETIVMTALSNEQITEDMTRSFLEGYSSKSGKEARRINVAEDFSGFNQPETAYGIAQSNKDAFIFPVAGNSNNGVYAFLEDAQAEDQIIAIGTDVDCGGKSKRIPFSLVINIDRVINEYLDQWVNEEDWPVHQLFGMEGGYAEIVFNESYDSSLCGITLEQFEKLYNSYIKEAIDYEKGKLEKAAE